jgi:hypothetical protein
MQIRRHGGGVGGRREGFHATLEEWRELTSKSRKSFLAYDPSCFI